jgi:hypothetical protein
MTQTDTLENVITAVHQQSANHFDEIVPLQEMEFDSLTQMWVSGKQVKVAPTAQRLFSNRLRVPYSYLSRCPEDLQARNLNYWIEQERQQTGYVLLPVRRQPASGRVYGKVYGHR